MIRRVSGTRRSASKVANPRRRRRRTAMIKRSNPVRKRRKTTAKRRKTTAKRRNPSHKRHTSVAHRRNPARRRTRRRNPSVAGINLEKDLLPIAVGSGLAIAVKAAISAMPFIKTQTAKMGNTGKVVPPALAFAAGFALNKYGKGKMVKDIGKYIALASIVFAIEDVASSYIEENVSKLFSKDENGNGASEGASGVARSYAALHRGTGGAFARLPSPGAGGVYLSRGRGAGVGGAFVSTPKRKPFGVKVGT